MADESKFEQRPGAAIRCEEWEALLVDALDGLLPAKEAAAFTAHGETCANCGDLLAHAQQGREWLGYLHDEPEVPASLLGKILERTAGPGAIPLPVVAGAGPAAGAMVLPWRRSFHETRLLMTVAMAFFSIALTLNLAGVKLSSIRLADLRPSEIGNTVSRQFYTGWGSVVRFYDNARFVYQLESRMRELRRDVRQQQPASQPTAQPQNLNKKEEPSRQGGNKDGQLNAPPERGAMLNARQETGNRLHGKAAASTEVRVSAVIRNSIPLGQSRAGLQEADQTAVHDRRSLV